MSDSLENSTAVLSERSLLSEEAFQASVATLGDIALVESKKSAWMCFQELPYPKRTDELWRFSKIADLELGEFALAKAPSREVCEDLVQRSNYVASATGTLCFSDDHLIYSNSLPSELADKGVIWMSLEQAFKEHPEFLKEYFLKELTRLGSEKFAWLHAAYVRNGCVLYVPKGVEIENPFVLYHWGVADKGALFPNTLIVAEANSKVSLVEVFASQSESASSFCCSVGHVYAADNAQVSYKTIQDWSEKTYSFQMNNGVADRNARIRTTALNLGSKRARFESQSHIRGEGGDVEMYSLTVANEEQEFDQRTHQSHEAANTTSDLLYKNALFDRAKSIFSGLILVSPKAQHTDAYQTNCNLLLSPKAEANTLPGLEIEANDVKCSHGATSSMIDAEELFYLQSRGVSKRMAQELLVFGFFEEILQKFESDALEGVLRRLIEKKLKAN